MRLARAAPTFDVMKRRLVLAATIVAFATVTGSVAFGGTETTLFSDRVGEICAGALLFQGRHEIGTRAGAIAVSRDIEDTGTRRLRRVAAVPQPSAQAAAVRRWLDVERRLVAMYSRNYLRIWDAIENADSPAKRALLPAQVHGLVHEPDPLKHRADVYELELDVPDCTGGGS